jgi:hypothetical protein
MYAIEIMYVSFEDREDCRICLQHNEPLLIFCHAARRLEPGIDELINDKHWDTVMNGIIKEIDELSYSDIHRLVSRDDDITHELLNNWGMFPGRECTVKLTQMTRKNYFARSQYTNTCVGARNGPYYTIYI